MTRRVYRKLRHGFVVRELRANGADIQVDSSGDFGTAQRKARDYHDATGRNVGVFNCRTGSQLFQVPEKLAPDGTALR
jgi:hypothetical protein